MSMKHAEFPIEIRGMPTFRFRIPKEDIEVLMLFATRHYDWKCKAAAMKVGEAKENGILIQWLNTYAWYEPTQELRSKAGKEPAELPSFSATMDDLDTLLKITEVMYNPGHNDAENAIAWKYHFAFKRALTRASDLYSTWRESFDAGAKGGA